MDKKNVMLGRITGKIVGLPLEVLTVLYDLIEKFTGEEWMEWLKELKKFLRKERSWADVVPDPILRLISADETLTLDAVDGSRIIPSSNDTFKAGIDPDFVRWGADQKGSATEEAPVSVYEMVKDAPFAQMFGSLSSDARKLCLTQHQILNFVEKHRKWLRTDGYGTFFLFESNGELFVAYVYFLSGVRLHVYVNRFEYSCVWDAEYRHRFVVPQLA